ncbi:MAG: type IV pilus modification protein PilV [Methylococcaceae bacterium]|nr:type IV pilus modification protein PilV [Methylococcaceae bacterium]
MKNKVLFINDIEVNSGFSMIEVLITTFVISVGILGLLALQGYGLKVNHNANLKSQVVSNINDMADRMRANSEGLDNNRYAAIDTSTLSSNPGKNCVASSCDDAELALYDIYAWGKGLSKKLPLGYGTVEIERSASCDDGALPTCSDASAPSCDSSSNLICTDTSTATCADTSTPSCSAGPNHKITVFWDDNRDGNASTRFSVTTAL